MHLISPIDNVIEYSGKVDLIMEEELRGYYIMLLQIPMSWIDSIISNAVE